MSILLVLALHGVEPGTPGARGLAMGGAATAVVRDASALRCNPAMLGFVGTPPAADDPRVLWALPADRDGLADRRRSLAVDLASADLTVVDKLGDAYSLHGGVGGGAGVQVGDWAVGYRLDLRVGLHHYHQPAEVSDTFAAINALLDADFNRRLLAGDTSVLTTEQYRFPAERLDLGVVPNAAIISQVPVSWGRRLLPNLAAGLTARLIYGRVTGGRLYVYPDIGSVTEYLAGTPGGAGADYILGDYDLEGPDRLFASYRSTWTVGFDAGLLLRAGDWSVGLTGRNLNRPVLRGPDNWGFETLARRVRRKLDVTDPDSTLRYLFYPYYDEVIGLTAVEIPADDIHLDTQVVLGIGWQPSDVLTLAVDLELLPTETMLPGHREQHLGLGVEYRVVAPLELRCGIARDLAADTHTLYSLGLGLDIRPVRIDLAVAATRRDHAYDDHDIPVRCRALLTLGADF